MVLPKDPKSGGSLVEAKGSRWDSDSVARMGTLMAAAKELKLAQETGSQTATQLGGLSAHS